jgi:hypothetical protein
MYQGTYEGILSTIVKGRLIHADETQVSIEGKRAYVWVFTTVEEVIYHYTKTREGDFLQELLRGFSGVLVSDFYAAYDSMNCAQQKCLIHLMRDLNDDLLKQPFNEELKELVREFARLLKSIIETVDRFGLKAHYLRKYKTFVWRFYQDIFKRDYQSEIAVYYQNIRRYLSGDCFPAVVHKRFLMRECKDGFESQLSASRSGIALRVSPCGIAPQVAHHGFEGMTIPRPIAMTQRSKQLGQDRGWTHRSLASGDRHLQQMLSRMGQEPFDGSRRQRSPDQRLSKRFLFCIKSMEIGIGFPFFKQKFHLPAELVPKTYRVYRILGGRKIC